MPNKYLDSVGLAEYTGLIKRDLAPKASPAFTGTPTAPTPSSDDDSTKIATTEFVQNIKDDEVTRADEKYLPLAGGTLTGAVNGVTPPNGDNSKKLANTEFIQALASVLVPTGCVQAFAGQNTPTGWLLCDGSAVSRVTYAKLFSVIGTKYGSGNGSTTFNVPNLIDRFVQGNATAGTVKTAGLPNISGNLRGMGQQTGNGTAFGLAFKGDGVFNDGTAVNVGDGVAAIQITSQSATQSFVNNNPKYPIRFNASKDNSIYGNSTTVQPPALTMRYIIKY